MSPPKKNQRPGNKEQTDSNQRGGGREITEERRGRVKSRNRHKGLKDKDTGRVGRTECERWGMGRAGESNGGEMGTTVIEQ